MRNTTTVVVVLTVVLLAGAVAAQQDAPDKAEECPKVLVSAVGGERAASADKFSATAIEDLSISVVYAGTLTDEQVVSFLVYTPRNHLYRRIDVPVAPEGAERGHATRRLPGYPYPVKVRTPVATRGGDAKIDVSFPVAGTTIVTSSLYGLWRVEVLIDGKAVRCIDAPSFYIIE